VLYKTIIRVSLNAHRLLI